MDGYKMSINKEFASFTFINDTDEDKGSFSEKWSHYVILHKLINFMATRGWNIEHDKSVHKLIRKGHWYGHKKDLEVNIERYPRGFKFDFFQNIVFENRNGGRYDFDKFEKMPYLIKLMYLNETRHMKNFLESLNLGISDCTDTGYRFAEDKIKKKFVDSWHHPQKSMNEFSLSDLDGQTDQYHYNNTDRDGETIYNGQIKYFRDWNGSLMRGRVYHNINNMWWVILDRYDYTNIADFNLFDPKKEDFTVRRLKRGKPPAEYLEKMSTINASKTKELIRELKKRGIKININEVKST